MTIHRAAASVMLQHLHYYISLRRRDDLLKYVCRIFTFMSWWAHPSIRPTCLSYCWGFRCTWPWVKLEFLIHQRVCDLRGTCNFCSFLRQRLHKRLHVYNCLSSGSIPTPPPASYIHPLRIPLVIVSLHKSLSCWWGLIPGCLRCQVLLPPPQAPPPKDRTTQRRLKPLCHSMIVNLDSFYYFPTVFFKNDMQKCQYQSL